MLNLLRRRALHLLPVGAALLAACNQQPTETTATKPAAADDGPELAALRDSTIRQTLTAYGQRHPDTRARIQTRLGTIELKLYADVPLHRANFVLLARKKFFDESGFYRIVKDFVIQGGDDDDREMTLGAYKVPQERNPAHFHRRGAVGMARYGDEQNPTQASSSHDFYIVQGHPFTNAELDALEQQFHYTYSPEQRRVYTTEGGAPALDPGYTVFGEVTGGQEVVKKICDEPVDAQKWPKVEVPMKVTVQP